MFSDIFGIKTLVPPTDSSVLLNLQSAPIRHSLPIWGRVREGLLFINYQLAERLSRLWREIFQICTNQTNLF